jgi:hypothetical protein
MNSVSTVFDIPFSLVEIWSTDPTGNPLALLWTGAAIENVQLKDAFLNERSSPSGCRYRVPHTLDEAHSISAEGLADFSWSPIRNSTFVLYIVWFDVSRPQRPSTVYESRTYFGVTSEDLTTAGRDVMGTGGMAQARSFAASFFIPNSGTGTPPGPATTVNA